MLALRCMLNVLFRRLKNTIDVLLRVHVVYFDKPMGAVRWSKSYLSGEVCLNLLLQVTLLLWQNSSRQIINFHSSPSTELLVDHTIFLQMYNLVLWKRFLIFKKKSKYYLKLFQTLVIPLSALSLSSHQINK